MTDAILLAKWTNYHCNKPCLHVIAESAGTSVHQALSLCCSQVSWNVCATSFVFVL